MASKILAITGRIGALGLVAIWLVIVVGLSTRDLSAQGAAAAIQGTVTDSSKAVIPGATITATNMETNLERKVTSNSSGLYQIPNLPPGKYRVQITMAGFQASVWENVDLVVGQQLILNPALQIGEITQQVTVTGEVPVVNTSVAQISGLVGERQIKDLPLNGRSFDNLITLNPGTVNTTVIKGGQGGASGGAGAGSFFSVGGRRPSSNLFLLNGMEYPGAAGSEMGTQPGGLSGQLLGIEAVREFNVVTTIDSAEYGHHAGGQISVVTMSGTNAFHGSLFEFLRNSSLDARNFFDAGEIPPFRRNQFGGSAGGPIQKDKTFVFGSYEGFRQRLGASRVAVVPDQQMRQGLLPNAQGVYQPVAGFNPAVRPYFDLWPEPNGPELLANGLPTGTALLYTSPPNPIREDFGNVRVDRTFALDTLSVVYTVDDGASVTPGDNPYTVSTATLRTQILSLTETHIISPTIVNSFTAGYSRPKLRLLLPVTVVPAGTESFVTGLPLGQIKVGGGTGTGDGLLSVAGSGPTTGSDTIEVVNTFSFEDRIQMTRGIHSITTGAWFQRRRWDEGGRQNGQAVFDDLLGFMQGRPSLLSVQLHDQNNPWRSWYGAWYVQDAMKLRPNLTVSIGLRHEFASKVTNRYGVAANYVVGSDGVLLTQPRIANSLFAENNSRFLLGPRASLAWDPFGNGKTSIRAGFGMVYNQLVTIGTCCGKTNPEFTSYEISNASFPIQINPATGFPPGLNAVPGGSGKAGGVQDDLDTPAVVNYRFEIEREVLPAMSLRVAYIGSHGYHDTLKGGSNLRVPTICSAAQGNCPAGLPDGSKYFPSGLPRRNPRLGNISHTYTSAFSRYNAFSLDLNRRFRGGLAFRANYTHAKSMDNASAISGGSAIGEANVVLDPYDRGRDYALSAFDLRDRFSLNSTYELPLGQGKPFLNDFKGVTEKLLSGWQLNAIAGLQGGLPFTTGVGFNRARDGNSAAVDRPNMAAGKTTNGIYPRTPERWYDPNAFVLPLAGTYGNAGRNILTGPGLRSFDFSLFKATRLNERWNLQFRAEFFNLFNHTGLGVPAIIALTTTGAPAPSAGRITDTTVDSRQIQFGLKLTF